MPPTLRQDGDSDGLLCWNRGEDKVANGVGQRADEIETVDWTVDHFVLVRKMREVAWDFNGLTLQRDVVFVQEIFSQWSLL